MHACHNLHVDIRVQLCGVSPTFIWIPGIEFMAQVFMARILLAKLLSPMPGHFLE